jgi:hypothetical protein
MPILKIIGGGLIAGILANATGYLITARLFHSYQNKTPNTWRHTESWTHYLAATAIRIAACIGIGFFYALLLPSLTNLGGGVLARGSTFGSFLWAVTVMPLVLEVALFVNWHRGFVLGLVIDWLVVYVLAGMAAAVAVGVT